MERACNSLSLGFSQHAAAPPTVQRAGFSRLRQPMPWDEGHGHGVEPLHISFSSRLLSASDGFMLFFCFSFVICSWGRNLCLVRDFGVFECG